MEISEIVRRLSDGFVMHGTRYFIWAGVVYLIFYVVKSNWRPKINPKFPKPNIIYTEIVYSVSSIMIFSIFGLIIYSNIGYTKIYFQLDEYRYWYLPVSFILVIIFHDAYFYWTHRLMHHTKIFKYVHKVHHLSTNPTPWASYSFHPIEGIVEAGIFPLVAFILPVNKWVLFTFLIWQISYNVLGHSGFELFPKDF